MTGALIAFTAGAAGIIAVILMARRSGRKSAEAKITEARLDAIREREKVQNEVEALPDDARRRELDELLRKPSR